MARWSSNNFLESHCLEQSTSGQQKSVWSSVFLAEDGPGLQVVSVVTLLLFLLVGVEEPGQWCLEGGRYQEPRTVTLQY